MSQSCGETVHTRASILEGLQRGDQDRWREFYRLYAPVIRGFALKSGLTETEADEVVQETCIGVAKNLPEFRYDPKICRFKTWLLNLTAWRVKNQLVKRQRWDERLHCPGAREDSERTATIERIPDSRQGELEACWEREWQMNLSKAALDTVRSRFSVTQWQMFDLNVTKEWPAAEVAKSLGVSVATVYLTKHRVTAALKREVRRIENKCEDSGRSARE